MDDLTNKIASTLDKIPIIADSIGLEYDTNDGTVLFTKKEVDYFDHVFYLLENDEDGYLTKKEVETFLQKGEVGHKDFLKMWKFISNKDEEKDELDKFEFFVMLKLTAFFQLNGNKYTVDDMFEEKAPPLPDFKLMAPGPDKVPALESGKSWFVKSEVDKPREVGTFFKKHTVYCIRSKTNLSHYNMTEFKTDRRFNDFLWLHKRLADRFPQIMIPPVPEKKFSGRFEKDFVETRRLGLQSFLTEVCQNPELNTSFDLYVFLTSSENGMDHAQKVMVPLEKTSLLQSVVKVGLNVTDTLSKSLTGKDLGLTDQDLEFSHVQKNLDSQYELIGRYYKALNSVLSYYKTVGTHFNSMSEHLDQVGMSSKKNEDESTRQLYETAMNNFGEVSMAFDQYSEAIREKVLTPVGYVQNKTRSVSGLILNRARAQAHLREAERDRERKAKTLSDARSKGRDKVSVAQDNLDKAKAKLKECKGTSHNVLVGLHENFVKFHQEKVVQFRSSMISFLDDQNQYFHTQVDQMGRLIDGLGFTPEEVEAESKAVKELVPPVPTLVVLGEKKSSKKHKGGKSSKKHGKKRAPSSSEEESEESEEESEESGSDSESDHKKKKHHHGSKKDSKKSKGKDKGKAKKGSSSKDKDKKKKKHHDSDSDSDV